MNTLFGAFVCAYSATRAFSIINNRKVILHCYCAARAVFSAKPATYTTNLAVCHSFFATAFSRARHEHFCASWNKLNKVFGNMLKIAVYTNCSMRMDSNKYTAYCFVNMIVRMKLSL